VPAQVARKGQSSRAALRPTVRSADGATPLGNRGGENSGLCLPSGCLDGDAPPLTLLLGGGSGVGEASFIASAKTGSKAF